MLQMNMPPDATILTAIMTRLAGVRPVFANERTFAKDVEEILAALYHVPTDTQVRLLLPGKRDAGKLDLVLHREPPLIVEFKRKLRRHRAGKDNRKHLAYDIWKLEHADTRFPGASRFALFLTDAPSYWKQGTAIGEGAIIQGTWQPPSQHSDMQPFTLRGTYGPLSWQPYSAPRAGVSYRYLLIEVP